MEESYKHFSVEIYEYGAYRYLHIACTIMVSTLSGLNLSLYRERLQVQNEEYDEFRNVIFDALQLLFLILS